MYSAEQKQQKKEEMLNKCFDLFVKQGLENTSVNDLAKYCGTYKAAFYNYFNSKDDIVFECAKMYIESIGEVVFSQAILSKEYLRDVLEQALNILISERDKMRFVYQVISSPKFGAESRKELSTIYSRYLDYYDQIAQKFSVDKEKFRVYYLLFVSAVHDFCLWDNINYSLEKFDYILSNIEKLQQNSKG